MNTIKKNTAFFAFGKANESIESAPIKRYVGIGAVKVLGVNPTKAELEKLYNTTLEKDPEYVGFTDIKGTQVPQIRIDILVRTEAEKCGGINMITKIPFYVVNSYRYNQNRDKVQIIDKYGRTAWATIEEAKANAIPMYENGPAQIDKDYRPAYIGEVELTDFIKAYLNISNPTIYKDGKWIDADNKADALCRLDNIANFFSGNVSELKEIANMMPDNLVKVMFGVKTNNEGKQYQTVFTQMFLKNGVTNYDKIAKELEDRKAAGAYSTTEFSAMPIHEYVVEATTFADPLAPKEAPQVKSWF